MKECECIRSHSVKAVCFLDERDYEQAVDELACLLGTIRAVSSQVSEEFLVRCVRLTYDLASYFRDRKFLSADDWEFVKKLEGLVDQEDVQGRPAIVLPISSDIEAGLYQLARCKCRAIYVLLTKLGECTEIEPRLLEFYEILSQMFSDLSRDKMPREIEFISNKQ